jgi:hypothetical protein
MRERRYLIMSAPADTEEEAIRAGMRLRATRPTREIAEIRAEKLGADEPNQSFYIYEARLVSQLTDELMERLDE